MSETAPNRAERLDRLPFNASHRRLLVGSGIGWALDAMDVGLMSFVMAALAKQWSLSLDQLSWVASVGFIGMALGASIGGLLADRIGRRSVFAGTLLIYGVATGASALAGSLAVLMVLRFLVGLGLGAELPVASTLVSEYAPSRIRGRVVVALESFWAVGWVLAAVIGYLVVPRSSDGWRWAFLIGTLPAFYALWVRSRLPESVRFLESVGRYEEAEAAVRQFEKPCGVAPVDSPPTPMSARRGGGDLWREGRAGRTAALWAVWFGVNFAYYGAFLWIPTLLVSQGFSLVRSFEYTFFITLAQLPGYALAAYLIEVWGRRATLATFLAGSAISAGMFGHADSAAQVLVWGCLLSAFNLGAWGALYAVTPEVYPTPLRGTGAGAAAAFGRLASIMAPLMVPKILGWGGGQPGVLFLIFGAAFGLATMASFALPDKHGEQLS